MDDKERKRFRKHIGTLSDLPNWGTYTNFQLIPGYLNSPTTAFDYSLGFFQEFIHFLDKKIGKQERENLLKEFYASYKNTCVLNK